MARCAVGAGEGITGFSLSLAWSDMSVLLLSRCFVLMASWCRGALGASTPVDDLGLADLVARVVGGGQAGGVADRAVDVGDGTARPAEDVVVVVSDPCFVSCHGPHRLDAPHQARGGQHPQYVIDGLVGY